MAELDKINNPEQEIPISEPKIEVKKEQEPAVEQTETSSQDKVIARQLRREIELMEVDPDLKEQAEKKAKEIGFLAVQEKIDTLLNVASERGLVFAIKAARATNDPFILDTLHDILEREGYYKKFKR